MLNPTILCPILIGRTAAIEVIDHAIGALRTGAATAHTLILTGEAGIGKSRLVAEAKTRASQQGFTVVQGQCFESDRALPYAPLIDLLRAFGLRYSPSELAAALDTTATELIKLMPELGTRLPQVAASPALEPEQEKRRLFQALVQFIVNLAAPHAECPASPALVIIEDVQWSDDTSLEFLVHLARRIAPRPIGLLITCRSDEVHTSLNHCLALLDRERLSIEIALARLTLSEVEDMIRAIFNQPAVRAEFVAAIHDLTDGNPFFVEEVLKSLVTAGEIYYANGLWTRKPLTELHTLRARSVQDAVQRRTQQLSEAARRLLTLAAVAGRRFDFALLQRITQSAEPDLLALIKELISAQLVAEALPDQFAFRHALTRQAIYTDLLSRERKALHHTVFEAMEQLYADESETHLADLAYQAHAAEAWAKALAYAQRAGEKAQALDTPHAAIEHFTHALEAALHVSAASVGKLQRARGLAYQALGEFDAARDDLAQALAAAQASNDQAAAWQGLLDLGFLWTGHDYARAGDYLQRALVVARTLDDPVALGHTLNRIGNWHMLAGQPLVGRAAHAEALTIFETMPDLPGLAATLDLLGITSYAAGDAIAGAQHYEQAVALFRQLNDRQGLISSLASWSARGGTYICMTSVYPVTQLTDCRRAGEEAIQLARQPGWRPAEANALIFVALGLGPRGEFGRALDMAQAGLVIADELEHGVFRVTAHMAIGAIQRDLLALTSSRQHLEAAYELAQPIGSAFIGDGVSAHLALTCLAQADTARAEQVLPTVALTEDTLLQTEPQRLVWLARAELALEQHDPDLALMIVERLIASAPHTPDGGVIPILWLTRARSLTQLDRAGEAEQVLIAAREAAIAQDWPSLQWRIHLALGQLYYNLRRHAEAERELSAARVVIQRLADNVPEDELRENFVHSASALFPTPPTLTPRQTAKQKFGGLTGREREVAARVAQGKSNRALADELFVTERTIEKHIESILSKLEFSSRAQIAVWAVETGLAVRDQSG
ncbi:MAG: AAA family ATPase [Chloroflexi bacterium]|nr:AAA family ATPase [Chloroflexota bacterium]